MVGPDLQHRRALLSSVQEGTDSLLPSLREGCKRDAEAKKESTAQKGAEIYLSRVPGIAECQIVISGR